MDLSTLATNTNYKLIIPDLLVNLSTSEEALNHVFSVPFETIKTRVWEMSPKVGRVIQKAEELVGHVLMEHSYEKTKVNWMDREVEIDFKVKRGVVCAEIKGKLTLAVVFKILGRTVYGTYSEYVDFSVMVFSDDFHGVKHELGDLYLDLYTQEV